MVRRAINDRLCGKVGQKRKLVLRSAKLCRPFVQGRAGERFVYIDIGTYAGQTNTCWSRWLNVPLSGITWDMLRSGKVLVAHIPGTGKEGGPSCAYEWRKRVGPSWQWQLGESQNRER